MSESCADRKARKLRKSQRRRAMNEALDKGHSGNVFPLPTVWSSRARLKKPEGTLLVYERWREWREWAYGEQSLEEK